MQARVRVGIVGCGEVTQILHLPSLRQLADLFEVTVICDVSRHVLDSVGGWQVKTRFRNYQDVVARDDVDAVLVANPHAYHSEVVVAALEAGKHVLVEKPMCITLAEADAIIAAQRASKLTVQVGTMRRYADAFVRACALVKALPDIRLARVHDVIGDNSLFIRETSHVVCGADVPDKLIETGKALERRKVQEAVESRDPVLHNAYRTLLGLSSHDTSAMRELLGTPESVLYAAARGGGTYLTAAFDYGGFVCHFETGVNRIADFDAHLEVYSDARIVRVQYNTPYVRNLPVELFVTETDAENATVKRALHPAWNDPFVAEWRAFYTSVQTQTPSKTDAVDFRHDLELFAQMVAHMEQGTTAR